jgi:hypothetical protein
MKKYYASLGLIGAAALVIASASGCQKTGSAEAASAEAPTPSALNCAVASTIDDVEDNDSQIATSDGRGGYIYTYADESGTTVTPGTAGFAATAGGAEDSAYAMNIAGTLAKGGEIYAGVGFNFTESDGVYDASAYRSISFYAKVGEGTSPHVRLQVADVNTDPKGGVCKECYNDFGTPLILTGEWKKYTIPFADLKQQAGWGDPTPSAVETSKLIGVKWQVATPGAEYDLWIDNVQLEGCL